VVRENDTAGEERKKQQHLDQLSKKLWRNPAEPHEFSVGKIGFGEDFADHAVPAQLAADSGDVSAAIIVSLIAGLVGGCPW
jgi:hypothetical protein